MTLTLTQWYHLKGKQALTFNTLTRESSLSFVKLTLHHLSTMFTNLTMLKAGKSLNSFKTSLVLSNVPQITLNLLSLLNLQSAWHKASTNTTHTHVFMIKAQNVTASTTSSTLHHLFFN